MELYEQILAETPRQGDDPVGMVELRCYWAITEIRRILSDESLEDPECFERIERIVDVMDELGIGGGGRHDFG